MPKPRARWRDVMASRSDQALLGIRQAIWLDQPLVRWSMYVLCGGMGTMSLAMGLLIWTGVIRSASAPGPDEVPWVLGPFMAGLGALILVPLALTIGVRRIRGPARWRSWIAEYRRCPICGYDLAGLGPEADGCLVCPECGSAWRIVGRCG